MSLAEAAEQLRQRDQVWRFSGNPAETDQKIQQARRTVCNKLNLKYSTNPDGSAHYESDSGEEGEYFRERLCELEAVGSPTRARGLVHHSDSATPSIETHQMLSMNQ